MIGGRLFNAYPAVFKLNNKIGCTFSNSGIIFEQKSYLSYFGIKPAGEDSGHLDICVFPIEARGVNDITSRF
jgi:hypothetical protein